MVGQQQIDGLLRRLKATYSAVGDANCTTPILRKDLAAMIRVLERLAVIEGAPSPTSLVGDPLSTPNEDGELLRSPTRIQK